MVKKYLANPLILSVLFLLFFFYSGLFHIPPRNSYNSLVPKPGLEFVKGELKNSPAKLSNGKYYSCKLKLTAVKNGLGVWGSAGGVITVFIPTEKVEAFFPGKLYSKGHLTYDTFFEEGGFYSFTGKISGQNFYVQDCTNGGFDKSLKGRIYELRAKLRLQFKRLMYRWGAAGGFLLALLSGEREYTESSISQAFKNAGLSHILALSGMHLSLFGGIAVFFGKKIGIKKLSFVIRCIALVLFVWFAGFSPSLLRAFLCNLFLILCALSNVSNPDMLNILAFSWIVQIIISPGDMHNSGFLLSYGALSGILIANEFFARFYNKFFPFRLAASTASSTAAQIFTAPISLKMFGSFAPVGIIATTVVSPLITIFIYTGLAFIVLCLIVPSFCDICGNLINILYNIIRYIVIIFSKFPRINI